MKKDKIKFNVNIDIDYKQKTVIIKIQNYPLPYGDGYLKMFFEKLVVMLTKTLSVIWKSYHTENKTTEISNG